MHILMLSIDKGLLGKNQLGDVISRHKKYGKFCERLDIIVFNKKESKINKISDKVSVYPTNSKSKLLYYFNGLKLAKNLFNLNSYDLIVCQEPFLTGLIGYKLKKKFQTKLLVHFHGDYNLPFKKVIHSADGIRVMSTGQKNKLIQKGIDENKIRIISTPINLDKFLNYTGDKTIVPGKILFVGRLEPVKNLIKFLNIYKEIKSKKTTAQLTIIGTGSLAQRLKSKADDSVQFLGQLPQVEIISHYYNSSLVILPSKSESFGKVLVEANACGKPVVTTPTTGASEIIQNGYNGFLTPLNKMADKILELLNNPKLTQQMGENGKKLVQEKYSDNTSQIIQFWQDLI